MSDSDDDRDDEDRPVTEEDCVEPEEDKREEAETSFTRDDELHEAFNPGPAQYVADDTDGMPRPVIDDVLVDAHSPPFLPEKNQICHEMAEEFVVRGLRGEIEMTWPRDKVTRQPNGQYYADSADGVSVGKLAVSRRTQVWPLRPQCKHLVLQLVPPAQSQTHIYKQGWMHRYCGARRSVAGAFLSLSEQEMKACSLREPFDLVSASHLTTFDRTLAEKSRNRTYNKMFNVKEDREHDEDKPLAAFEEATAALINAAKEPTP